MRRFIEMFRTPDGKLRLNTFVLVCSLFLLWGAFSGMIDVLNKHFQDSLNLSKAMSGFVQGAWYGAYFLIALPAGWIARKLGYRGGILTGLALAILGCLMFVPAVQIKASQSIVFAAFLTALFVVGAGMTCLETVANPYTTLLGTLDGAVARINLAQTCNAVGWMVGPMIIGAFVMSKTKIANTSNHSLYLPYLALGGVVAVLLVAFLIWPAPDIQAPDEARPASGHGEAARPLHHEWHFIFAVVAQFFYVAGQTGVFSFFINYVKDKGYSPAIPNWLAVHLPRAVEYSSHHAFYITQYGATTLLSIAFGCFAIGRLSGSMVLRFAKPHLILALYGLINTVLMVVVVLNGLKVGSMTINLGWIGVIALVLSYFFMSIMYPTIFALGIKGLGKHTKLASGFIVMSIVGGALAPFFMGWIADRSSMRIGFVIPLICFAVIMLYGFTWKSLFRRDMLPEGYDVAGAEPIPAA